MQSIYLHLFSNGKCSILTHLHKCIWTHYVAVHFLPKKTEAMFTSSFNFINQWHCSTIWLDLGESTDQTKNNCVTARLAHFDEVRFCSNKTEVTFVTYFNPKNLWKRLTIWLNLRKYTSSNDSWVTAHLTHVDADRFHPNKVEVMFVSFSTTQICDSFWHID